MKALILFDTYTPESVKSKVSSALDRATISYRAQAIGTLDLKSLKGTDLVIYIAGGRYVPGEEKLLADYVKSGKNMIVLGGNPFSIGSCTKREQNKGIRAFGFSDTFLKAKIPPVGKMKLDYTAETEPLKSGEKDEAEMSLSCAYEGLYMLAHDVRANFLTGAGNGDIERHAQLTPIAGFYDGEGHRVASPVVRISYTEGGRIYLFAYEMQGADVLENELMSSLLGQILRVVLVGQVEVTARMTYPRYNPGETPTLEISRLLANGKEELRYDILFRRPGDTYNVYSTSVTTRKKVVFEAPITGEGAYDVTVRVYVGNVCVDRVETAFFICEETTMRAEAAKQPRLRIDPKLSTDFCLADGKLFPIHGTTYFVTDAYQKCFLNFNPLQCRRDLELLQKDGFNTLRSGNWMLHTDFFGRDGAIVEYARRALQVYFYLAAQHGFQVQFTLGNIALNDWDKSKCAVHNPQNTAKVLKLMESFGSLFGEYKNVSLDILNEPSYSLNGAWTPIKPSGDPYEKAAWIQWLQNRYTSIQEVWDAWGEPASKFASFKEIDVPPMHCYEGNLYRTECDRENAMAQDFWRFAQESYNLWLSKVRAAIRKNAPDMLIMMGRDETLRIPMEQDGVLSGNLDMVCWHQWNKENAIYAEYMLNRVKGHVSCAQELGVYRVEKMRGSKILSDETVAGKLERKLMFGFGNWVEWQSFHNPDKTEHSENMLGVYRSDNSETPAMPLLRSLMQAETKAAPYLYARKEDAFPILTVYQTTSHYSVYKDLTETALRRHLQMLNRTLRMQSDLVLEHLLEKDYPEMIGKPKLIFVPGAMRLSDGAYDRLLELVGNGATLVISGDVEEDSYFAHKDRIALLLKKENVCAKQDSVKAFENIRIRDKSYLLDFRQSCAYGDVENNLKMLKMCVQTEECMADEKGMPAEDMASARTAEELMEPGVREIAFGDGKIIYSPLPLELADGRDALEALYRFAIEEAGISNEVYQITKGNAESVFVHAIAYEKCTAYTFVNDGPAIEFKVKDLASGAEFEVSLDANRSAKVWISANGEFVSAYGIDENDSSMR